MHQVELGSSTKVDGSEILGRFSHSNLNFRSAAPHAEIVKSDRFSVGIML